MVRPMTEREKKARELASMATPRKVYKRTERMYLVTITEENTEFCAAMESLADIAKWFSVKPL